MGKGADEEALAGMPIYTKNIRWETWEFQLKLMIADKGLIAEKKKVNFLLKSLGLQTLEKVMDWCSPDDPRDRGFDDLIALMRSKFAAKKNKFALRLGVLNEKQQPDETCREYFSKMTQKFGECQLQKMKPEEYGVLVVLRGLANDDMRDFLMNPANDISSVEKLEQLAVAFEESRKAAREIKDVGREVVKPWGMNVVGKGVPLCNGCGNQHGKQRCAAKDVECWYCKKVGHFARLCKTRKAKEEEAQNQVTEDEYDSGEDHEKVNSLNGLYSGLTGVLTVTSEEDADNPPIYIHTKVNNRRLKLLYDTGAGVTVVNKSIWAQIGKPKLHACDNLRSYNGIVKTLGKCLVEAKLHGESRKLWITVVEKGKCLLGRDWMKSFKVHVWTTLNRANDRGKCCKPTVKYRNT